MNWVNVTLGDGLSTVWCINFFFEIMQIHYHWLSQIMPKEFNIPTLATFLLCLKWLLCYTPAQRSCWGYPICPSVRPSVRLSRTPCPLCSANSSVWIHNIFTHVIKRLQKVCGMYSFCEILNFEFLQFFKLYNFVLFWLGIWCESLVWVIMRRGYLRTQAF